MNWLASAPSGVAQHEALLVGTDGGANHLRRDGQELRVELAHQHHRPFDEAGHLLEQRLVLDEIEAAREGEVLGLGQDDVLAAVGIEHDLRVAQRCRVVVEAPHLDGPGRHEAMPEGRVAGRDTVDGEAHDIGLLRLRPERGDDGVQGSHPGESAGFRRSGAPAHGLRPREGTDDVRQDLG